jgi:hypothetical protein
MFMSAHCSLYFQYSFVHFKVNIFILDHLGAILIPEHRRKVQTILKTTTLSKQLKKQSQLNIRIVERGLIDTTISQIHDRSKSWLGTDTSIKNGGFDSVVVFRIVPTVWLFLELFRQCDCF